MAKSLDAPYAAGARGSAWLKIKAAHTLDLVVLAVERGSGRRSKWLSNIHLGARDPASGGFVMLGKTFKGMTDEILEWQTRTFDALAIRTRRLHRLRASGDRRRNCIQRRAAKPALPGRFRVAARTRLALPTGQESERGRYDRAGARDLRRREPQTGRRPRVARASTPTRDLTSRPCIFLHCCTRMSPRGLGSTQGPRAFAARDMGRNLRASQRHHSDKGMTQWRRNRVHHELEKTKAKAIRSRRDGSTKRNGHSSSRGEVAMRFARAIGRRTRRSTQSRKRRSGSGAPRTRERSGRIARLSQAELKARGVKGAEREHRPLVLNHHPTIVVDRLAGHPGALLAAEINDGPRDLLARTHTPQRDAPSGLIPGRRAPHVVETKGIDQPGTNRIHADAVLADLLRHRCSQRLNGRFTRRISRRVRRQ